MKRGENLRRFGRDTRKIQRHSVKRCCIHHWARTYDRGAVERGRAGQYIVCQPISPKKGADETTVCSAVESNQNMRNLLVFVTGGNRQSNDSNETAAESATATASASVWNKKRETSLLFVKGSNRHKSNSSRISNNHCKQRRETSCYGTLRCRRLLSRSRRAFSFLSGKSCARLRARSAAV